MARVAVMGDTESIKGFAVLGLDIFPCDHEEEAGPLFRRLTSGGEYGVVFLTERLFVLLEKDVKRLDDQLLPAVIPIPGVTGDMSFCGESANTFFLPLVRRAGR